MLKNLIVLLIMFVSLSSLRAGIWIVDSFDQGSSPVNGTLTLRGAITAASPNDTIYIQVTGELRLTSQLGITKPLKIIGPSAKIFAISGALFTAPDAAILISTSTTTDTLMIEGITIRDFNHLNKTVHINPGSAAKFTQCLFKNNHNVSGASSVDGGALSNAGVLVLRSVAFTNNHGNDGGALHNIGICKAYSCAFQFNNALNQGGGFYNITGTMDIVHGTFFENNASVAGGGGRVAGAGGGFVYGTMFYFNTAPTGPNLNRTGANTFYSAGYNMLNNGVGSAIWSGSDITAAPTGQFGLHSTTIENGYGMEYVPIVNSGATSVNFVLGSYNNEDIRMAPRHLSNLAGTNYNADCGAFEFTPFVVTNTSSGTGTANSLGWCVNQININSISPAYVGFHLTSAGQTRTDTQALTINQTNTIIDGYSQPGSKVPGPTNHTTSLVNGLVGLVLDGSGGAANSIVISALSDDTRISGLGFINRPNSSGIRINGSVTKISGCSFGTTANGLTLQTANLENISIQQGSWHTIGGIRTYERNTFGNHGVGSIYCGGSSIIDINVVNNVFGLNGAGESFGGAQLQTTCYFENIDDVTFIKNVFANSISAVYMDDVTGVRIENNYFGTNANGTVVIPNTNSLTFVSCGNVIVGGEPHKRNVFSGDGGAVSFGGVFIDSPNGQHNVSHNYVGLLPDGVTAAGNLIGVEVLGSVTPGITHIFNNVISGNNIGVHMLGGSAYVPIYGNIIGLTANGMATGVGNVTGVRISDGNNIEIGQPGAPNYISGNTGNGILILDNLSGVNFVRGNYIGFLQDGITPAGNGLNGIRLENSTLYNQIGGSAAGAGNKIAYNLLNGIEIIGNANSNVVSSNEIHNNVGVGVVVDGAGSTSNFITENSIRDNGGLGIDLRNGAQLGIETPEIIGVTVCGAMQTNVSVRLFGLVNLATYFIEVFEIPPGGQDPSGFGEGNTFLMTESFNSPVMGTYVYNFDLPGFISAGSYISLNIRDFNNNTSEFSNHLVVAAEPTISGNVVDVFCFGGASGSIDVTVAGGSMPFTYDWKDGGGSPIGQNSEDANGLTAGGYYLDMLDASGCPVFSQVFNVLEPSTELLSSATGNNLTCFGANNGALAISAFGGTPGYTYSWYTDAGYTTNFGSGSSISNVPAGTYYPIVTDNNGCTHLDVPVVISEPAELLLSEDFKVDITCFGFSDGQIQVSASGGSPPYEFSNNGGFSYQPTGFFSGLSASNYTLMVRDNNACTNSINIAITQPSELTIGSWNVIDVDCFANATGQVQANAVVGGTPPYQISVNSGLSFSPGTTVAGLSAGSYDALLQDSFGCFSTNSPLNVMQPPALSAISSGSDESCFGALNGEVYVFNQSGGVPPYNVEWYSNPGYTLFVDNGDFVTNLSGGDYYPVMTDANGCTFYPSPVTIFNADPIFIDIDMTNVSCFGGNNGQAFDIGSFSSYMPISFQWLNSSMVIIGTGPAISGLTVGNYIVVATDVQGCQESMNFDITGPSFALSLTVSDQTDPTCNGFSDGSIEIAPFGGTPPYQFSNNNGSTFQASGLFSGLSAGTYQMLIQDANGCVTSQAVTLNNPTPVTPPVASSNSPVCLGSNISLFSSPVTGATYSWTGPNGFSSSLQNPTITGASYINDGIYTVTATVSGCTSVGASTTVSILYSPEFNLGTVSNPTACGLADGSILLLNLLNSTGFDISYNDGSIVNLGIVTTDAVGSYLITGLDAGTYSDIRVEYSNGCIFVLPGPINLVDPSAPAAPMATSNGPLCAGAQLDLGASNISGASYAWTGPGGFNSNLQSPSISSVTTAQSGTYLVTATVAGCTGPPGSVIVNIFPLDDATISPAGPLCVSDGSVILSSVTSGGIWSASCGMCIDDVTGEFVPAVAGAGSHTVLYETVGACPDTDSEVIIVNAVQDPTINSVPPVCENQGLITITSVSVGGSWSASCGACIGNLSGDFDPSSAGAGIHRIYYQTSGLCGGVDSIDVVVNPLDDAFFIFPDFCAGATNGPSGIVTPGGVFDFSSAPMDGATINSLTGEITGATAGSNYLVSYLTNGACPASQQESVSALATDDASFTLDDFCEFSTSTAVISGVTGGVFSFNTPPSGGETINPSNGNIVGATGGQTYQVLYTTSGACPGASIVNVTVNSIPIISSVTTNPSCWNVDDGAIEITASGTISPYLFSIDGGSTTQSGANTMTFTNLGAGTYNLYIEDNVGCTNTELVQLTAPSTVGLTVDVTDVSCNGANDGSLILTASGGAGPTYQYTLNGGSNFGNIPAAGFVFNYLGSGPGNFTIFILDANGCSSDTILATISQPAPLQLAVSNVTSDTCGLGNGSVTLSLTGGTAPYGYNLNGGSGQLNPFFGNLLSGNYLAGGADINGCTATQVFTVGNEIADLSAQINPQVTTTDGYCPDSPVILSAANGFGTYAWTGANLDSPTSFSTATTVPSDSGVYIISVSNGGCTGTDTLVVYANTADCPFEAVVNNAFSPDGDGTNDIWHIVAVESSPNNEVRIFNRWGDLLRTFVNYNNLDVAWDGTDELGRQLPAGTYFYTINVIDMNQKLSGWVYLIR